jgi:hypothetical protein
MFFLLLEAEDGIATQKVNEVRDESASRLPGGFGERRSQIRRRSEKAVQA